MQIKNLSFIYTNLTRKMKRTLNNQNPIHFSSKYHNKQTHIQSSHNIKALSLTALLGLATLGLTSSCEQEPDLPFFNECSKIETNLQKISTTSGKLEYIFKSLDIIPVQMSFDDVENFCITDLNNNKQIFVKTPKSNDNQLVFNYKNIKNGEITQDCNVTFNGYYKTFQIDFPHSNARIFSESSSEKNCFLEHNTHKTSYQTDKYLSKITRGKKSGEIYVKFPNGKIDTYNVKVNDTAVRNIE